MICVLNKSENAQLRIVLPLTRHIVEKPCRSHYEAADSSRVEHRILYPSNCSIKSEVVEEVFLSAATLLSTAIRSQLRSFPIYVAYQLKRVTISGTKLPRYALDERRLADELFVRVWLLRY